MKSVGWRYESARHALAAKGIRTRGYFVNLRERLRSGEGEVTLYHGTYSKNVPRILDEGLKPGKKVLEVTGAPFVYVTPSVKTAESYSTALGSSQEEGDVLKVKIPVSMLRKTDYNLMNFKGGEGTTPQSSWSGYPENPRSVHSFTVENDIPPRFISVMPRKEVDRRSWKEFFTVVDENVDPVEKRAFDAADRMKVQQFMERYFARKRRYDVASDEMVVQYVASGLKPAGDVSLDGRIVRAVKKKGLVYAKGIYGKGSVMIARKKEDLERVRAALRKKQSQEALGVALGYPVKSAKAFAKADVDEKVKAASEWKGEAKKYLEFNPIGLSKKEIREEVMKRKAVLS